MVRKKTSSKWQRVKGQTNELLWSGLGRVVRFYRKSLKNTTFIAVTGSCAKTTTKELIAAVLAPRFRLVKSFESNNARPSVAKTIFRTRDDDAICLQEIGALYPGSLDFSIDMLKPDIAVVTNVMRDHYTSFRSREAVAEEKRKLVRSIPPTGTVILNMDDPLVLAMSSYTSARVLTYGLSGGAFIRAEDIASAWPERLNGTLICGEERIRFRTQLCGSHWIYAVLAAAATGYALGISPYDAVDALENAKPVYGRMSPVETDEGITFIEDHWKAPMDSIGTCLEFLRHARAKRKIMIMGHISDYPGSSASKYVSVARSALDICDRVIFVGPHARSTLKARPNQEDVRLQAFERMRDADVHLREIQRPGDLILLKASGKTDHFERLVLSRQGKVACWRMGCKRTVFCSRCRKLNRPSI